jgi:glyoxylase-like metal-dependent hydrolase (beta-lactamase superfamily II)
MNLEDNAGDIIRKARMSVNATAEAAAKAAGITVAQLEAFEQTGEAPGKVNYAGLAGLIALDAGKLEGIVKGWLPQPVDVGVWQQLRVFTTTGEGISVNSYLVWDEVSREAALFDTGWDASDAIKVIEENKLTLRHLFITHTHEDHIAGIGAIRAKFPKVHLHSNTKTAPAEQRNRPNDFFHLGSLRISHRDTPGHAEDGVTYIVGTWPEDAPHVAIVGDAIFSGSMVRGNQSWELAKQKVREQILSLPADTLICPGHGPLTTVAQEKAHNPFF